VVFPQNTSGEVRVAPDKIIAQGPRPGPLRPTVDFPEGISQSLMEIGIGHCVAHPPLNFTNLAKVCNNKGPKFMDQGQGLKWRPV
jgi:hypothetical protein